MVDEYNEIRVVDKFFKMQGSVGEKVSLLALTIEVCGVTTNGLKYQLQDGILKKDNSLGINNEFLTNEAEVMVESGVLLVIKARKVNICFDLSRK